MGSTYQWPPDHLPSLPDGSLLLPCPGVHCRESVRLYPAGGRPDHPGNCSEWAKMDDATAAHYVAVATSRLKRESV